ncbi:hypothetical protein IWQ49_000910 [Labrenzia sp. EL_126]|nr:hypothetical protein [Labrenzia sp. EL_126]
MTEIPSTKTLYFDESGFTGYNLLDPKQPIFVVASADFGPESAADILAESFPRYRGAEYKFSNIWRSNNKAGLVRFGEKLPDTNKLAFTWIVDKRFLVLTKIVDFLIEPYITDTGYDFYADGFCWKYTNYIHFGLTQYGPSALYDSLLHAYQTFSRNPNLKTLGILQSQLRIMSNSTEEPIQIFLEQMALGAELFTQYKNIATFNTNTNYT